MSVIIDQPESYFSRFIPQRSHLLQTLEAQARDEGIPIIGPMVGELLYILAHAAGAARILELGTATGYSAIFLAAALPAKDGRLITLELDADLAARATANVSAAGYHDRVEIRVDDALSAMTAMETCFDLIFIDIEKDDYVRALPQCERLLRKGGLLVADNVAFRDADSFNRALAASPAWRAVNLLAHLPLHSPEKDAVAIALRV